MNKSENIKRRRKALAQAMKQRQRIEDDSDLIDLVYERMANNDGEFIELDLGEELKVKADMVNHPPHYKDASGVECIEVTSKMQFCGGNCFKYLYRAGKKGSTVEDLKKAKWYAGRASELGEKVVIEARNKIKEVMRYRELGIYNSMRAIRFNNWMLAVEWIEAEIARLESEAADE